ncbi:nucleotidyltransferase domain-containing protein [Virgibacillus sp. NKC19-16]|uniref:nucleotidyltransferase domain-containing protein n=1 Tax=Virgibacillus salidurans TaxID=2831673 RepID=UPI001F2D28B1|nr:nucleotidyltransferase domain-containing protein [Virgibacillus sp. NKC19-16]UJL47226.1 nucleotidyltransferase domain-containing protein [Virgibacillus sp. NKC19-16]
MSNNLVKSGIPELFLEQLLRFCSSNSRIKKVILFGSRARGDFCPSSDIDLAVQTNNATHSEQNLIEDSIQEMPTHLRMDIVFLNRLSKEGLLANIKQEGIIIYEQGKTLREA